jgi:hypothetical protein
LPSSLAGFDTDLRLAQVVGKRRDNDLSAALQAWLMRPVPLASAPGPAVPVRAAAVVVVPNIEVTPELEEGATLLA